MLLQTGKLIEDLERWSKSYFENLKAKNYSTNTIELYTRAVDNYIEYMRQYDEEMTLKEIKGFIISGYLFHLDENAKNGKLSNSSKESYLKGIFGLLNFISDNNNEFFTFERVIEQSKVKKRQHKEDKIDYLTDLEYVRIKNWLNDKKLKLNNNLAKLRLIVKFMLYAGLRVSEALNLRYKDLEYENDGVVTLKIIGKGDYQQKAIIPFALIEPEINFLENDKSNSEYIYDTTRQNVYIRLNRLYKKIGIRPLGCHVLRHTLAMNLVKSNTNITIIKDILRHSSLNETQKYAKAEYGEVKKTIIKNANREEK